MLSQKKNSLALKSDHCFLNRILKLVQNELLYNGLSYIVFMQVTVIGRKDVNLYKI